jgi:AcrR family transcriptional regulator
MTETALNDCDDVFTSEQKREFDQVWDAMTDENLDRRAQRTRQLLRRALLQLIDENGYDAVTIQDITDRANLGRTTFYLHYQSKDDLLLDHHAEFANKLILERLSYDQIVSDEPPEGLVTFLQMMMDGKKIYFAIAHGKDADIIRRSIRQRMIENLRESLRAAFPNITPSAPEDALTQYIVGAQWSLIDWWISTRTGYNSAEIAVMIHRLQRAAIQDAYGMQ